MLLKKDVLLKTMEWFLQDVKASNSSLGDGEKLVKKTKNYFIVLRS